MVENFNLIGAGIAVVIVLAAFFFIRKAKKQEAKDWLTNPINPNSPTYDPVKAAEAAKPKQTSLEEIVKKLTSNN